MPRSGEGSILTCGDRAGRAVEIDDEGWRVVDRSPAKFRRTRGSQPLPEPERGGSLEELHPFFNVAHDDWILIRAFPVAALRPGLPPTDSDRQGRAGCREVDRVPHHPFAH
jgi:hypothetical protein